jgi:hypothetical protein
MTSSSISLDGTKIFLLMYTGCSPNHSSDSGNRWTLAEQPIQEFPMQKLLRSMLVASLSLGTLTACSDDDGPAAPVAQAAVRVVHASPNAPNVDVLVDEATALTNVPFIAASGSLDVPAGARRFRVRATGTTTTVIDVTPTLLASTSYTVLATGLLANIQPLLLTDDRTAPSAGQVKLRVVHAAPAAANVDVYVTAPGADITTATPTLSNVAFRGFSSYLAVPAGEYRVRVVDAGTKTPVAIDATLTFAAGQVRTIVARDNAGGGAPLNAIVLNDLN